MELFTFTTFPKLITERLFLRELSFDDVGVVLELRSNKEVNAFISRETPKSIEDATEFIASCHKEFRNRNQIFWGIEYNSIIIGSIVFHRISTKDQYAEIGYELFPKYQQNGFMNEAMKRVLEFGTTIMQLKTIEAFTHKNNIPSIALLEKHGFIFQPKRKCEHFAYNRIFKLMIDKNK